MNPAFFFSTALVLAAAANGCYFLAAARLARKGISVKFLAQPRDLAQLMKQYQAAAPANKWSPWPVYGFWLFGPAALVAGLVAAVSLRRSGVAVQKLLSAQTVHHTALWWITGTSLSLGGIFTWRLWGNVRTRGTRLNDWRQWATDEYARNDFYVAVLCWCGFLLSSIALLRRF